MSLIHIQQILISDQKNINCKTTKLIYSPATFVTAYWNIQKERKKEKKKRERESHVSHHRTISLLK